MPIYWKLLFLLIIGMPFKLVIGQPQHIIDSLETEFTEATDPLKKSEFAYKLAFAYMNPNPKKGLKYVKTSLSIIPKDSLSSVADNYGILANLCAQVYPDSLGLAISYIDTAIYIYKQIDPNKHPLQIQKRIANAYFNKSNCYIFLKEYEQALENLYKSLEIYEEMDDGDEAGFVYGALFSINLAQNDLESALKNAKKNYALSYNSTKDYNRANSAFNVGLAYMKLHQADSAINYLEKALTVYQKIEDNNYIAITYSTMASVYRLEEQLELAIIYLNKAIALEAHITSASRKLNIRNTLAAIYHLSEDYQKSILTYQKILNSAIKIDETKLQLLAHQGLAANYEKLNNFEVAYSHLRLALPLKDSVLNEATLEQSKSLEIKYQTKYESQKKEQENQLLAKDLDIQTLTLTRNRQQFYGLLGLFILGGIISYLGLRQYRNRSNQQMLELKHRLLRNQMNPHFIFNALVAIQNFVYKNDPRKAGKYLSSFAKLVRAILENSRSEYITLSKEIQWLENYLNLQLLRFNNKFDFDIQIDDELNLESILIPPMLTQPFIENALEHGIKSIDYHGELTVKFTLKEDLLLVAVQDNGIGLSAKDEAPEKKKHISLATKITKERLDFLNKKSKEKIHLEMKTIEPSGTLVAFSIPLNYIY